MQHEQELVELAPARVEDLHQTQHLKPPTNHGPIILRRTLTAPVNEVRRDDTTLQHHLEAEMNHIKNEEDEDLDLESEEDHEDSDYEAGKETRLVLSSNFSTLFSNCI